MRFEGTFRGLALIAATAAAGCSASYERGSTRPVPIAQLDRSGKAPTRISLGGPDKLVVSQGDTFTVNVEGDEQVRAAMRFSLEDDSLNIGRSAEADASKATAIVRVTVPHLQSIAIGGSGSVEAERLSGRAEVAIGGSGTARIKEIEAHTLDVAIGGSGSIEGAGSVRTLDVAIGGSGSANLRNLKAEVAEVSIGGSGDTQFSSDGTVTASIAGSGDVTVFGRATCTVNAFGSGRLRCDLGTAGARPVTSEAAEQ